MKTIHITKNLNTYYEAKGGNTTYILDKGVSIASPETIGIVALTDVEGRNFVIRGEVFSALGAGIHVGGNGHVGAGILEIEKSGKVSGKTGVNIAADGEIVRNAGVIGGDIGVDLSGDAFRLANTGQVNGTTTGIDVFFSGGAIRNDGFIGGKNAISTLIGTGDSLKIVNTGTIDGGEYGISLSNLDGSRSVIVNHGTITGDFWAIQANFTSSVDIIRNRGEISTQSWLGNGDDIYDGRGGHAAYVDGGKDNDLYIIDDPLILLNEQTNSGIDTVRSSVTWTLGANFENLVLTGKDSITGKGSDQANRITGNDGHNTLYGFGASDIIDGGKGNDTLYGGAAADTFVFINAGGQDLIADFQDSLDIIDITAIKGINDFAQILESMTQVGADVVIDFGARGSIEIDKITIDKLTAIDFAY